MTSKPVKDMAASVHQRLLNRARELQRPFNELLQYYSMERLLYRLSRSPHGGTFILKGALMLTAWKAPLSRPTMDIDLLGRTKNSPGNISRVISAVCRQRVPEDGVEFDPSSIRTSLINENADYQGVRARVRGRLGNARLAIQIDVGFGDTVTPKPAAFQYPTILPFPPPKLLGYTRESAVAEKFEAMIKLGLLNSRMKDCFDIWLLASRFDFDGPTLTRAIHRTFERRGTLIDPIPDALTGIFGADASRQLQWRAFLRRNRLDLPPLDLREVTAFIARFLLPVADQAARGGKFSHFWQAPGPWSPVPRRAL